MDERDLMRHLEEGGKELWEPTAPPKLDLAAAMAAGEEPLATPAADGAAMQPARRASAPATSRAGGWFSRRFQLRPLALAGGGFAAVLVGLALGAIVFGGSESSPQVTGVAPSAPAATPVGQVALARFGDGPAPPTASALASMYTASDGKTMKVAVKNLPVPPHGSFYELWAIGKDGKMVSLGNVPVDANGSGTTEVPVPVSLRRYPILDISLEPADGEPTHSGHSVLRSA
jgi:hypothetical protein